MESSGVVSDPTSLCITVVPASVYEAISLVSTVTELYALLFVMSRSSIELQKTSQHHCKYLIYIYTIKTIASKVVTATSIPFTQAYSNLMQQLSVNL